MFQNKRQREQGRRSDAKATKAIEAAGWTLSERSVRGRYVATKRVIEDDHTITRKFESSYTLDGLRINVTRRERESA